MGRVYGHPANRRRGHTFLCPQNRPAVLREEPHSFSVCSATGEVVHCTENQIAAPRTLGEDDYSPLEP